MEPVFVDLHIHTSMNPSDLPNDYDLESLECGVKAIAGDSPYMISLTDHNTINKQAYIKAKERFKHILLGVELHIRNYEDRNPYHCHIYFDLDEISEEIIDNINSKLDELYPKKEVSTLDEIIPSLEDIIKAFDSYEFILLPHAGQSHSPFHKSVSGRLDSVLERNIYYNHFDGFTARSNTGLEKTKEYFKALGINEFVNLLTSSDNYSPNKYPNAKSNNAEPFVPTWMLANPSFSGLRLSLSESSRMYYGEKPDSWMHFIRGVKLSKPNIEINADLLPGLNVVIGGSSSGKTLLVDSIYRKLAGTLDESDYKNSMFEVSDISVDNPNGVIPHYFYQNYIIKICDQRDKENSINDISILRSVFPSDLEERAEIDNGISTLTACVSSLVGAVKDIQDIHEKLEKIPLLSHLIVTEAIHGNPINSILPNELILERIRLPKASFEKQIKILDEIDSYLGNNPLLSHNKDAIEIIKRELNLAFKISNFESRIRDIVIKTKDEIDKSMEAANREITTKRKSFESLLALIRQYIKANRSFKKALESIAKFKIKIETKKIVSMGHTLYIDNHFELSKLKFLEVVNGLLRRESQIKDFNSITPETFFSIGFRKRDPIVRDYNDFELKIKNAFMQMNKKQYKIVTKEGKNFETLSAGWKTSVILDLILGWENDNAPLIIDQPEDNLATGYINDGLIKAIKNCKKRKQIILVSHNATIPMLGDAQNVIMCKNTDNKIEIYSNPLEGNISGRKVLDLIAEITDGGKISIKKRVKKYNLKNFRGNDEDQI